MATIFRTLGALLFDGLTTAERDALKAQERLFIFNTDTGQFEIYLSGTWYGLLLLDAGGHVTIAQHGTIVSDDLHPEYARIAAPEEITATWILKSGGGVKPTAGDPPVGEIVVQVKTAAGAPSHSATQGTFCWVAPDDDVYVNNNGSTGWTKQAKDSALHAALTVHADGAHSIASQVIEAVLADTGQTGHMSGAMFDALVANVAKLAGIDAGADVTGDNAPKAHKASHQNGGGDEVATATPGANAIPKAGAGGKLAAGWVQEVLAYADLTDDPYADHSGRHEDTGADEINVGGLSGELADDQPPKAHGSGKHTGKIGEVPFILTIPLAQPLAGGEEQAVIDYEHRDWGNGVTRINRIYARARSNVTGDVTLKLHRNGAATHANDTVTISNGTRESSVTILDSEIILADGNYLDIEQTTSVTDDVAVDFYVLGDQDVVAAV